MIKRYSSSARVNEINASAKILCNAFDAQPALAKDPILSPIMADIKKTYEKLTAAILQTKLVSQVDEADSARDTAIRSLAAFIDAMCVLHDEECRAAAAVLKDTFSKYGRGMALENNRTESSLIMSFLADTADNSVQDALDALGAYGKETRLFLSDLKTAQDAFEKADAQYTASRVNKTESATELKKSLLSLINDRLVPFLTSVYALEPYAAFAHTVEAEIANIYTLRASKPKK